MEAGSAPVHVELKVAVAFSLKSDDIGGAGGDRGGGGRYGGHGGSAGGKGGEGGGGEGGGGEGGGGGGLTSTEAIGLKEKPNPP